VVWLALAPRWLTPPALAEALGVAWLIINLMPQALINSRVIDPEMSLPADEIAATWWARALLLVRRRGEAQSPTSAPVH
jgi:hypothetical protein